MNDETCQSTCMYSFIDLLPWPQLSAYMCITQKMRSSIFLFLHRFVFTSTIRVCMYVKLWVLFLHHICGLCCNSKSHRWHQFQYVCTLRPLIYIETTSNFYYLLVKYSNIPLLRFSLSLSRSSLCPHLKHVAFSFTLRFFSIKYA